MVASIPVVCSLGETARLTGMPPRALSRLLRAGQLPLVPVPGLIRSTRFFGTSVAALLEGRAGVSLDELRKLAGVRDSGLYPTPRRWQDPNRLNRNRAGREPISMANRELPRGIQRIETRTNRTLQPGEERRVSWSYRANVRVGKRLWQKTYPNDTPLKTIKTDREVARRKLEDEARTEAALGPREGTIAKDIQTYLELKREMPSYDDREREISMWKTRFGHRARNDVKPQELAKQIAEWEGEKRTDGERRYSPTTINHWRAALSDFYTRLNGRSGYNPLRDVPKLQEPDAIDRAQPMPLIRRILAQMETNGREFAERVARNGKVRAAGRHDGPQFGMLSAMRAKILAYTGMRAGELMTLAATDLRLDGNEPVVLVRTGKGGKNRRVPLTSEAVAAFKAFRKANAFGEFSESSFGKSVRAACARLTDDDGEPIPAIRPHDFRHSFATWLVNEGGVSLKTAKEMLGHRNIKTTERYIRASEDDARRALKRLEAIA
jgi:integrase